MSYTVDYFIKKFEAIPEEKWCIEYYQDCTGKCCALGHCGKDLFLDTPESDALDNLFFEINYFVSRINDGLCEAYLQATPKQRILAALYDIKKLQS